MIEKETKLDFHDLRVKPIISRINSRSEIDPFYKHLNGDKYLPIFTAPMDTVISSKNAKFLESHKIHTIIPRGENPPIWGNEFRFKSIGLDDFLRQYINVDKNEAKFQSQFKIYILIDMANGHMQKLIDASKKAKEMYGDKMVLMVGNVASPETFKVYAEIGVDLVRLGIGGGGACLTAKQTSINYPMGSLINECRKIKDECGYETKIVADGGMKDYSDIILALALGADYVMVGSLLNKALESCADTYLFKTIKINQYSNFAKWLLKKKFKLTKNFRGMSTKEVQRKWGKKIIKTSEGISKIQTVEYTTSQWIENFEDYLRSTMSYSNAMNLQEFIGKVDIIKVSDKSYQRFNK